MNKCDFCKKKLIKLKYIWVHNGKGKNIEIKKCVKCGEEFMLLEDVDKISKKLLSKFRAELKQCLEEINEVI